MTKKSIFTFTLLLVGVQVIFLANHFPSARGDNEMTGGQCELGDDCGGCHYITWAQDIEPGVAIAFCAMASGGSPPEGATISGTCMHSEVEDYICTTVNEGVGCYGGQQYYCVDANGDQTYNGDCSTVNCSCGPSAPPLSAATLFGYGSCM